MRLYGLTGGIASGKSTVAGMLRALGAHVIDADQVARDLVRPGTEGLRAVAARFPDVLAADGSLDRGKLAARIFHHADEREALNALLHPRIQEGVKARTEGLRHQGISAAFYDAALLIENGLHRGLDGVLLVAVPHGVQRARLMARDGLSEAQAEARMGSQLPLEEKRRHATWVVDNAGALDETRAQVEAIWKSLSPPEA